MARQNNLGILNAVFPEVRFFFFSPVLLKSEFIPIHLPQCNHSQLLTLRVGFWTQAKWQIQHIIMGIYSCIEETWINKKMQGYHLNMWVHCNCRTDWQNGAKYNYQCYHICSFSEKLNDSAGPVYLPGFSWMPRDLLIASTKATLVSHIQ